MSVMGVTPQGWILALFIRSDGERLLLGDGAYEFKDSQQHFDADDFENDTVEVQGNDGTLLAGQVRRASVQSFDGYIGDATTTREQVESYRRAFFMFFRKNFTYTVVYVFCNGTAIQRKRGYIVDAPEVKELWQKFPEYHVALNFEDVNYYAYDEDESGAEIYAKSAAIPSSASASGGLVWDSVGIVWDDVGAEWEAGSGGGSTIIGVDSIDSVYPVWVVTGVAQNPVLTNVTTGTSLTYTGTVTASQVLRIDMFNKTATLNGTSVIGNVSGDWVFFQPGNNRTSYTTNNADTPASTIEWQEIVG